MIRRAAIALMLLAGGASAQGITIPPLAPEDIGEQGMGDRLRAEIAPGAVVRALDKVSGDTLDLTLVSGQSARFGRIEVTLGECRFPADNPEGDAFAYLVVAVDGTADPVFAGWMIASSPALNAMDNARYDVWVLRCTTS